LIWLMLISSACGVASILYTIRRERQLAAAE